MEPARLSFGISISTTVCELSYRYNHNISKNTRAGYPDVGETLVSNTLQQMPLTLSPRPLRPLDNRCPPGLLRKGNGAIVVSRSAHTYSKADYIQLLTSESQAGLAQATTKIRRNELTSFLLLVSSFWKKSTRQR